MWWALQMNNKRMREALSLAFGSVRKASPSISRGRHFLRNTSFFFTVPSQVGTTFVPYQYILEPYISLLNHHAMSPLASTKN